MTIIVSGDEDQFIKINSQWLSAKDLSRYNNFNDIVAKLAKDPDIKKGLESSPVQKVTVGATAPNKFKSPRKFLTGREIAKLPSLRTQIDVLLRMREASEIADKVFTSGGGKKGAMNEILNHDAVEYVWNLLLPDVNAAAVDGPCVASGWITTYHKNSCARANPGRDTLILKSKELPFNDNIKQKVESCARGNGLPCNPMIFGFEDNNGTPICIRDSLKTATKQCNERAPLAGGGKEKIIQSIVAAKGKDGSLCKLQGEETVSDSCLKALDSYTDGLRQHYSNAADFCTGGAVKAPEQKSQWVTRGDIRADQKEACDNLRDRYFALAGIGVTGGDLPVPPPIKPDDCAEKAAAGSKMDANGQCICESTGKAPTKSQAIGEAKLECAAVVTPIPDSATDKKPEECGEWSWCKRKGAYIAVGAGLIVAGLLAWLLLKKKKKDKKDPVYETPAPVPEPTATVTVSPSATITPVDPAPTDPVCDVPPNSIISGVCTPPTVVPPEPLPSEGGTSTGTVINGGVR
jgi:hypothetical protein